MHIDSQRQSLVYFSGLCANYLPGSNECSKLLKVHGPVYNSTQKVWKTPFPILTEIFESF